jgi:hypothetical protein
VLNREKVIVALEAKQEQFRAFNVEQLRQRQLLEEQLETFFQHSAGTLQAELALLNIQWPGALPTAELDQAQRLRLPFAPQWSNHQEARAWAKDIFYDRPTIAVDGSQITPSKEYLAPVGAVQIGWFINHHNGEKPYVKDIDFIVLAPAELGDGSDDGASNFPNWRINQERFVRECETLCDLMARFSGAPDEQKPLCFFDGSFIISFAGQMRPERARPYISAVERLLHCSEDTRVPLVAYVDSSFSRDFVTLLDLLAGTASESGLSDAGLLGSYLPNWGDRTPCFLCARADSLSMDHRAAFYPEVAFSYVRFTADRPPARLEMPAWLLAEGRAEEIVDLVRAECVVGAGYPYAIETADALAVISQQDRERFYAIFEQFAQRNKLPLARTRKAASKLGRR